MAVGWSWLVLAAIVLAICYIVGELVHSLLEYRKHKDEGARNLEAARLESNRRIVEEAIRQMHELTSDLAEQLAAKSLSEKVQVDANRELLDVQLQDVREAYLEERARREKLRKSNTVSGINADGEKVEFDLNDSDWDIDGW